MCHQLGFGDAVRAPGSNYFGSYFDLYSSMPVWLDGIRCTSVDRYLSECIHNGWGQHDCSHSENAGVVCNRPGLYKLLL